MTSEKIGQGIEYINVGNGDLHVVRITRDLAQPFIIGSLFGKAHPTRDGDRIEAKTLNQFLKNSGAPDLYPTINNKKQKLVPLWVSNGTFWGLDSQDGYKDKFPHFITGPVVQSAPKMRRANAPKGIGSKIKRWVHLHNLYRNGSVAGRYAQLQGYSTALNIRNGKVQSLPQNKYGSRSWQWVAGGAAALVENGVFHTTEGWWQSPQNGEFSSGQWYSTGPIIADNQGGPEAVYLIMHANKDRSWHQAAAYLQTQFLKDIGHPGDGSIQNAVVYDGGSSKQLWIRGKGEIPISPRDVPHYLCLWGKVKE